MVKKWLENQKSEFDNLARGRTRSRRHHSVVQGDTGAWPVFTFFSAKFCPVNRAWAQVR